MQASQTETRTIKEDRDADQQFVIHPQDDDLFVRTGRQVIEHCRLGIGLEGWLKELHTLLADVSKWCLEHATAVRACYVAPVTSRVTLFFIPMSDIYDFDLGMELAELNIRLVQQYNVGMVETRQVPSLEKDRFFRTESSRPVYGDSRTAH